MKTFKTLTITAKTKPLSLPAPLPNVFYNALDCMLTREIYDEQQKILDPISRTSATFTFSLQRIALKMMLRGVLIDPNERERMLLILSSSREWCQNIIDTYALAMWGRPLNPGSWKQKAAFLYDFLQLPEQKVYNKEKGGMHVTTNRAALESLRDRFANASPILRAILAYQDVKKAESVLRSGIDHDGRMRSTFIVAGPETGRMASRKNVFGKGMNFQNVRKGWRTIFSTAWGPMPDRDNFSIPERFRNLSPVEDGCKFPKLSAS